MKTPVIALGWVLTAVAAFFAGGVMGSGAPEPAADDAGEVASLREQVRELTTELAEKGSKRERVEVSERTRIAVAESFDDAGAQRPADGTTTSADDMAAAKFSLENASSGEEASRAFMEFAEAQLARGEAGHVAIMDALSDVWSNRELVKQLFGDETQAVRELYPWIKFLVEHETDVVGLSDYVFRTMADDPKAFEKIPDGDILEMFTEGVAVLLPGAVDEETLARFRGYAERMLATPESEQPKAVAANRRRIERLLATFWAEPIDPADALERLKAGDVPPGQIARLLRLVPPEMLAEIDVGALVVPLLREGNRDAMRVLTANPNVQIDAWRTDTALLEGMAAGKVQPWFLTNYFSVLGHDEWNDVRPFFDRALGAGGPSLATAANALSYLQANMRPDALFVQDVLSRYEIEAGQAARLRKMYGLEE